VDDNQAHAGHLVPEVVNALTTGGGLDDNQAQAGHLVPDVVGSLGTTSGGWRVGAEEAASGQLIPVPPEPEEYVPDIVSQAISCKWAKGSSGPAGDEHHNLVTAFSVYPESGQGADLRAVETDIAPALGAETLAKQAERGIHIVSERPQAYTVHGEHSTAMTGHGDAQVAFETERARSLDTCGGYATNQGGTVVAVPGPAEQAEAQGVIESPRSGTCFLTDTVQGLSGGGGKPGQGYAAVLVPKDEPEDLKKPAAYPLALRGREDGAALEMGEEGTYNALRAGDGGSSRQNLVAIEVEDTVGTLACNTGPGGHDAGNLMSNQAVDAGYVIPVKDDPETRLREGGAVAFDWQAGGGNDESWRGGPRSWTVKQGDYAGSLDTSKVQAVAYTPEPEPPARPVKKPTVTAVVSTGPPAKVSAKPPPPPTVAPTVFRKATKAHHSDDWERWEEADAVDTLAADGMTNAATAVVTPQALAFNQRDEARTSDVSYAVQAAPGADEQLVMQPVVYCPDVAQPVRTNVYNNSDPGMEARMHIVQARSAGVMGDISHAIPARAAHGCQEDGTGRGVPIASVVAPTITAGAGTNNMSPGNGGKDEAAMAVAEASAGLAVRRLLPVECERLQGLPDGHTDGQVDSHRYRQVGNAVAVPVVEWIARRMVITAARLRARPAMMRARPVSLASVVSVTSTVTARATPPPPTPVEVAADAPRALDLYCGKAARGLDAAGWAVVGMDTAVPDAYSHKFMQADPLDLDADWVAGFDFVWASPPAPAIDRVRDLLVEAGVPFVLEGAPGTVRADLSFCGRDLAITGFATPELDPPRSLVDATPTSYARRIGHAVLACLFDRPLPPPPPRPFGTKPYQHVVMFSGGAGSWATAKLVAERHGTDGLTLLFADTKIEDEDTYRFLHEAAANVGGELVVTAEGRTPWEVFKDRRGST